VMDEPFNFSLFQLFFKRRAKHTFYLLCPRKKNRLLAGPILPETANRRDANRRSSGPYAASDLGFLAALSGFAGATGSSVMP
jgi:hypothetical protein